MYVGILETILSILWPFGTLMVIWYIFPILVFCTEKNLATLTESRGLYLMGRKVIRLETF
jgi:hypothetical protein